MRGIVQQPYANPITVARDGIGGSASATLGMRPVTQCGRTALQDLYLLFLTKKLILFENCKITS